MINNEITSWTQPVGSEIKGDKHGDSERTKDKQSRVYKSLIMMFLFTILIWRPVFGIQIKAYLNNNQI
jgi:hypothetical protein